MEDHGLGAAMTMARIVFEQSSRRSGRTESLLLRARPGDVIVVTTARDRMLLKRKLEESGKADVRVSVMTPDLDPRGRGGTNREGATLFDHSWIEAWWTKRIAGIRDELVAIERDMSTEPPPAASRSDMAWRFSEYEHRR
ncbi:hypothetical protein [Sphingomonas sp. PAMC 26605]|uniref:hypothetical protein n=1 Tax=Sphingomonas sp. PAMC 26605 TaxID=1112214 RepID=UPI00026CB102|nr:hypothetical protein [Sphingomonas sp. PAMC 26605]